MAVLVPVKGHPPRYSRPDDFVEESEGVWRLKGTHRHFFGSYQCVQCGVPIDDGDYCNDCFHFLEKRRRMRRESKRRMERWLRDRGIDPEELDDT